MLLRTPRTRLAVTLGRTFVAACLMTTLASARADDPVGSITLGPRDACVTPVTRKQARADGGIIDVQLTSPTVLVATLTGTSASNAILGCESTASQTFHLRQEFIVNGPPQGAEVTMTLESTLIGLVRARHKAGSAARLASAKICPLGAPDSPLVVIHPPFEVGSNSARLCNQRLVPIRIPNMPTGPYVLTADFVIFSGAGGLADGHAAADFSPTTSLPADWVRNRDPFQGADKKDFGFRVLLTVEAPNEPKPTTPTGTAALPPALNPSATDSALKRTNFTPTALTSRPTRPIPLTGLDRHSIPR